MFRFKNLQDTYIVGVRHTFPDDTVTTFGYKLDILAHRIKKADKTFYRYQLLRRYETQINGEPSENISDVITTGTGDSLYPLVLLTEENGEIQSVENFADVKARRLAERKDPDSKYPGFEPEPYFNITEENMKDEKTLLTRLWCDAFIQFYFRDTDKSDWSFRICDFPDSGNLMIYYALRKEKPVYVYYDGTPVKTPDDSYEIHPAFLMPGVLRNEGTVYCQRTAEGDLGKMDLNINLLKDDYTYYRRKITLLRDEKTRRAVNSFGI